MRDLSGISIAQYKILRKLADGNMGAVYKAQDTRLQRLVAIKFLPSDLIMNQRAKERFIQEARAASAIDHPNICSIYEFNQTPDGLLYIVMPFYRGESLKDILAKRQMDYDKFINIAIQIIEALASAHQNGIIHKDIKPANIFITDDGTVKLLDFGIAKLTGQDKDITVVESTGTIAYMSPEQILGEEVDTRSDIWSLGIVLFEMLCGKRPFGGDYIQTITYSILNEDPPDIKEIREDIPAEMDQLVRKMLAKKPRNRYHLTLDILQDLQKIKNLQNHDIKQIQPPKTQPKKYKRSIKFLLSFLIIFIITVAAYFYFYHGDQNKLPVVTVLPFNNMNTGESDSLLSLGLSEQVLNALAKMPQIQVRPWQVSLKYGNAPGAIGKIHQEIGGRYFISGKISLRDNNMNLTVQLINARETVIMWTETYNRSLNEISSLPMELAVAIATLLNGDTQVDQPVTDSPLLSKSNMANGYYLRGRGLYYLYSPQANQEAIELFKRALEMDFKFALAHAGLADAFTQKVLRFSEDSIWLDSALSRTEKSLALDPNLAEAYKAQGMIYYTRSWFNQSIQANQKALQLNHSYAPAMANLGWSYLYKGDLVQALNLLTHANNLNPANPSINIGIGFIYLMLGYDDAAVNYLIHAHNLQPDHHPHPVLLISMFPELNEKFATYNFASENPEIFVAGGYRAWMENNIVLAATQFFEGMARDPQFWNPFTGVNLSTSLGALLAQSGQVSEADTLFKLSNRQDQSAIRQKSEWWGINYDLAAIYTAKGETKNAITELKLAVSAGFRFSRWLKIDPVFKEIRDVPELQQLIEEIDRLNQDVRKELKEQNINI